MQRAPFFSTLSFGAHPNQFRKGRSSKQEGFRPPGSHRAREAEGSNFICMSSRHLALLLSTRQGRGGKREGKTKRRGRELNTWMHRPYERLTLRYTSQSLRCPHVCACAGAGGLTAARMQHSARRACCQDIIPCGSDRGASGRTGGVGTHACQTAHARPPGRGTVD